MNQAQRWFQYLIRMSNSGGGSLDPNISLGDTFLTTNAKTRAYWNFTTQLTGVDDAAIVSVADLRGNGWTLGTQSGVNTPKEGVLQEGTNTIKALKAATASTLKQALVTNTAAQNLLIGSPEVHMLIDLTDGQQAGTMVLFGSANGGTQFFRLRVNAAGNLQLEYAAQAAGLSTLTSSGYVIPNGFTGIHLIRLRCDFVTDVISGMINGVPITFSLTSGNAISTWNPAIWTSGARGCGVGGDWSGSFAADGSALATPKYILKTAVTDLLTDDEYLIVAASLLNY